MKKEFLNSIPEKQRDTLIGVLWNAEVENKKIANISFKQPYDMLSKIENKSDFSSVRRGGDFRLIRSPSLAHSLSRDCSKHPPDAC